MICESCEQELSVALYDEYGNTFCSRTCFLEWTVALKEQQEQDWLNGMASRDYQIKVYREALLKIVGLEAGALIRAMIVIAAKKLADTELREAAENVR